MTTRVRCRFSGIVQGVGFRPFIYRTARRFDLAGFVQNRSDGVVVEVEGPARAIEDFFSYAFENLPPLASISGTVREEITARGDRVFQIVASDAGGPAEVLIAPDVALCDACRRELFDPYDRRRHYPFINCTDCGPRLTIIKDVPYDRANTSMACFPLCPDCRREYEDPADRRFHAEPNACPACGPILSLHDGDGVLLREGDPLEKAARALREGAVVAVKGLGGFHLAVDATNDEAVRRLRSRKYREEKPLALMVSDMDEGDRIAEIGSAERVLLCSHQRPIVLVRKKEGTGISPLVAPGMPNFGIMLPYTPLHHLLLGRGFRALVMTSGNQTDEPICIGNREAITRLCGIADFFLVHNRDIVVRCDDSIACVVEGKAAVTRRARGFVPNPLVLGDRYPAVLAVGPQSKATICILKGDLAFMSPHVGDLETPLARDFFHESIAVMERITECRPHVIACDLHPGYYSTMAARKRGIEGGKESRIIAVQHHHAHIVSCMAEHRLTGKLIGIAMDGSGYGKDGHVWGGEFLIADERAFTRAGHLKEFPLPGGEKAVREPWRIAASLLRQALGLTWMEAALRLNLIEGRNIAELLDRMMERGINSPLCSSLGRVFDGVAAILGLRRTVSFEGQAAMELEGAVNGHLGGEIDMRLAIEAYASPRTLISARKDSGTALPFTIEEGADGLLLDLFPAIRMIAEGRLADRGTAELASAFHQTLAEALVAMTVRIREKTKLSRVALSGGCFQNRVLLQGLIRRLAAAGFEVFSHRQVPTNDGGIALGQAVCAGARIKAMISDDR